MIGPLIEERIARVMQSFEQGAVAAVDTIAELTREWDRGLERDAYARILLARAVLDAAERAGRGGAEAYAAAGALRQAIDQQWPAPQSQSFRQRLASLLETQLEFRPDDRYDLIRAAETAPAGMSIDHRLQLVGVIARVGSHRAMRAALERTGPTTGGVAAPGVAPELATRAAVSSIAQWCVEPNRFGEDARTLYLDLLASPTLAPLVATYLPDRLLTTSPYRLKQAIPTLERRIQENRDRLTALEQAQAQRAATTVRQRTERTWER